MNQKELVKAVSKECLLSQSVVEDVIESLKGVLIEELIHTGKTTLPEVFHITSTWRKGYRTPVGEVPSQEVLKIRINRKLRDIFRYFGPTTGKSSFINAKNWREFLAWAKNQKNLKQKSTLSADTTQNEGRRKTLSSHNIQQQLDEILD